MAFKLTNPPYQTNQTPIYHVDMEEGVMGKANNNGTSEAIVSSKLNISTANTIAAIGALKIDAIAPAAAAPISNVRVV